MAKRTPKIPMKGDARAMALMTVEQVSQGFSMLLDQRDAAYQERNLVLAVLSKCFPSHLTIHTESDEVGMAPWDPEWKTIVCIHFPTGQGCWHIHDSEVPAFSHLTVNENHWDGHTTAEKYARLAQLPAVMPLTTEKTAKIKAALAALGQFIE